MNKLQGRGGGGLYSNLMPINAGEIFDVRLVRDAAVANKNFVVDDRR